MRPKVSDFELAAVKDPATLEHGPAFCCRACDGLERRVLLELGALPLANAFTKPGANPTDVASPVTLVMCTRCALVQLEHLVARERLFGSYLWLTGTSRDAKRHATWLAERLSARHACRGRRLVEVASNDGLFLENFRDQGFEVLGVEPSNLAAEASARGLPSITAFFGRSVARSIVEQQGPADVIVARNVLGHASELQDLVAGIACLLAENGVCVIESPYVYFLREELQYDTIFHEHSAYLSVQTLHTLLGRFGLVISDVSFVDMNGGSFLLEVVQQSAGLAAGDAGWLAFEARLALNRPEGWDVFARRVLAQRAAFVALLTQLAAQGKRVVGYGAAAKCMTMLNFCGVGRELLSAIGDSNPRKQGLLCPGVAIPVVAPSELLALEPDYVMIGAWNFKDEIMHLLREELGYRGKFIIPLPEPMIVA